MLCEHTTTITDYNTNEQICCKCGMVIAQSVISDSVNISTNRLHQFAKTHAPTETLISFRSNELTRAERKRDNKLRFTERTTYSNNTHRNLKTAYDMFYRNKDVFGLSQVCIDEAIILYKKIQEKKLIKGRSIKGMVSTCLYISCKKYGIPRTLREICEQNGCKPIEAQRYNNRIIKVFDIGYTKHDPILFISRISDQLKLPEKIKRHAVDILKRYKGNNTKFNIISGAVLYVACLDYGLKINQMELADICQTTPVSLRKRIRIVKNGGE